MFSSILDTVRIADENQLVTVEAFLMKAALSGNPAVLAPNQAMDSAVIQSIVAGNEHGEKNSFIRAVELGIVRVSIPSGNRSLLEYCLSVIDRAKESPESEFIFSSLSFLYQKQDGKYIYDYKHRVEVLKYIYTELSESRLRHRSSILPAWLATEEKELVERYVSAMLALDRAVRYYEQFTSNKNRFPALFSSALISRLAAEPEGTALHEFLPVVIAESSKNDAPVFRSYYYRFCEKFVYTYGAEAIREVKEIADLCYNKLVAISLDEQSEMNIAPDFSRLAAVEASGESAEFSMLESSKYADNIAEKLDWETLTEIYSSVERLCEEKGLTWQEALEKFHASQSKLPFALGGKYALITSLTMAVSSIPVVGKITSGLVSEFMWNLVCDASGEILKKPSFEDIIGLSKQAKKNIDLMNIIVFNK